MQVSNHSRRAPVVVRSIATVCAAAVCCAPLALLASCGGKPGPRMAVMRVTHRLTENKPHETEVVVGGEVVNDLPFAAGTGYSWSATGFNSKILALKSQESKSDADESMPGGPMIEHFVFEGVKPGETTITFELRRPWEKDVAPAETRTMKVKVVKATN